MKYKGVELLNGNEYENEFCVGVQITKATDMDELIDETLRVFSKTDLVVWVEDVMDDYLLIRNNYITFDQDGLDMLNKMYTTAIEIVPNETVLVDVQLNEFVEDNGERYNNFSVQWGEFIENLEY